MAEWRDWDSISTLQQLSDMVVKLGGGNSLTLLAHCIEKNSDVITKIEKLCILNHTCCTVVGLLDNY